VVLLSSLLLSRAGDGGKSSVIAVEIGLSVDVSLRVSVGLSVRILLLSWVVLLVLL